jgi:hypothetical protein
MIQKQLTLTDPRLRFPGWFVIPEQRQEPPLAGHLGFGLSFGEGGAPVFEGCPRALEHCPRAAYGLVYGLADEVVGGRVEALEVFVALYYAG